MSSTITLSSPHRANTLAIGPAVINNKQQPRSPQANGDRGAGSEQPSISFALNDRHIDCHFSGVIKGRKKKQKKQKKGGEGGPEDEDANGEEDEQDANSPSQHLQNFVLSVHDVPSDYLSPSSAS